MVNLAGSEKNTDKENENHKNYYNESLLPDITVLIHLQCRITDQYDYTT